MEKQTSSFKVTVLLLGMDLNGNLTLQRQQMRYLDLWILPDNNPEIPENSTCNSKSNMSNSNPYHKSLKILYTNCDQFPNKRDHLLLFISGNEPDIILLNEVIPKAQVMPFCPSLIAIPNYAVFSNFDPSIPNLGSAGKRGIIIFVSDKLHVSDVTILPVTPDCEHLWIRLKLCGSDSLLIGCIYRSPSSDTKRSTECLCEILQKVTTSDSHLLICGDFNYSNIKWSSDSVSSTSCSTSQLFLETFQDLFLFQHVYEPTRYCCDQTPHILDLVFTNEENMIDTIQFYPGLANSDHVCLMFNLSCYTLVSDDTMQFRYNLRRADFEKLRCLLDAIDWNGELANLDINQQWSYFSNILTNCLNDSIPLCKPRACKNIYITHEAIYSYEEYKK